MMNFLINVSFFFMENFSVLEKRLSDPPVHPPKIFPLISRLSKKFKKVLDF